MKKHWEQKNFPLRTEKGYWKGVPMQFTERIHGDILIVVISGRLTFYSRKVFQAVIKNAGITGSQHVIINLEGVSFIDSAALGNLALAHLDLMAKHVPMSLVGPKPSVKKILEQANFSQLMPTYPTEELALQSVLATN